MKKVFLITFALSSLISAGCTKNKDRKCPATDQYSGKVIVVKDCTGTYIRYREKDYRVCNEDLLKYYTDGSRITANFSKANNCSDLPLYLCNMYHQNEGLVAISCIQ
jgi:hypothetical protein